MTTTIKLESVSDGRANVTVDGKYIGRVERISVGIQTKPGQYGSEDRWFALNESRVSHARPELSGAPSFRTRREAVDALANGTHLAR